MFPINIHVVPEAPSEENRKSKVNPKRQKLAELAASLKSSDKRSERARKRIKRTENNHGNARLSRDNR